MTLAELMEFTDRLIAATGDCHASFGFYKTDHPPGMAICTDVGGDSHGFFQRLFSEQEAKDSSVDLLKNTVSLMVTDVERHFAAQLLKRGKVRVEPHAAGSGPELLVQGKFKVVDMSHLMKLSTGEKSLYKSKTASDLKKPVTGS